MSHDWEIKEGDRLPELEAQIRDPSGDVADLSSVQDVEFRMAHIRGDTLVASASASITDVARGLVQYNISDTETGEEGLHAVEWRVTRSSGETYSYPRADNQTLFIHSGVGRELTTTATMNGTYQNGGLDADSIDTEQASVTDEFNNIKIATSIDDIQTKLEALPGSGGIVRLLPGDYDDSDSTLKLQIPSLGEFTIDMSGASITLDSFFPTAEYILCDAANGTRRIDIRGRTNLTFEMLLAHRVEQHFTTSKCRMFSSQRCGDLHRDSVGTRILRSQDGRDNFGLTPKQLATIPG